MDLLFDKYISQLSEKYSISKEDLIPKFMECINKTGAKLNIDSSVVYAIIHSDIFLLNCLRKTCSKLEYSECEKSCHCVYFDDKCMSRYIKDAHIINKDPDKFVKGLSTKKLESIVKYASFLYYNYDGGGLTDNAFDALEYHLKKRTRAKNRIYQKIGAEPIEKLRVKLPYNMYSLEKIKPGQRELYSFLEYPNITFSDKLDGTSGMIVYKDGRISGMFTRGDGTIGGLVSYLENFLNIPKTTTTDMVVRGEFILTKEKWSVYKDTYANARSLVNGTINSGHVSPVHFDIDFVAYEIVKIGNKEIPPPSQAFKILKAEGFIVPYNETFTNPTVFEIMKTYKTRRETSDYFIDGLVLQHDKGYSFGERSSKYAFKMLLESQIRSTKVIDVEWNISRYGKYTPVAIYESVYVDNVRLHRALAHNAAHIRDWNMGKGTEITVARSGDVIPQIQSVKVDKNIQPIYPSKEYGWHWSGTFEYDKNQDQREIVLDDIEGNEKVKIARITHFFKTIGVRQFGEKRIEKCWESGLTSIKKIIKATPDEFRSIKGFGDILSVKIYEGIHEKLRTTPIDRYLVALTTFKINLGRKLTKTLILNIPNILELDSEQIEEHLRKKKIKGFGKKRVKDVIENIPKFRKYLFSLDKKDIQQSIELHKLKIKERELKGYNSFVKDKKFVLSGFMGHVDYDLEDFIYDNKGDIVSNVTREVKAVIVAQISNITNKMSQASSLNIPVLSIEEFSKKSGFTREN